MLGLSGLMKPSADACLLRQNGSPMILCYRMRMVLPECILCSLPLVVRSCGNFACTRTACPAFVGLHLSSVQTPLASSRVQTGGWSTFPCGLDCGFCKRFSCTPKLAFSIPSRVICGLLVIPLCRWRRCHPSPSQRNHVSTHASDRTRPPLDHLYRCICSKRGQKDEVLRQQFMQRREACRLRAGGVVGAGCHRCGSGSDCSAR